MLISGYMVDSHQCENGDILLTVSYVIPGGRSNHPTWEKQAFIKETHRSLNSVLNSIVNYIVSLDIPPCGYAKIEI